MQKTKPIEYLQSVLYHIKYYYWQKIITAIFVIVSVLLELIYVATGNKIYFYSGVATSMCAVLLWIIVYANKIANKMWQWIQTMDEERSNNNAD